MIERLLKQNQLILVSYLQGYNNIQINKIKPVHINKSGNLVLVVKDKFNQRTILKIAVTGRAVVRLKKENEFYLSFYKKHFSNCYKIPKLIQSKFTNEYNYLQMEQLQVNKVIGNPHYIETDIDTKLLKRIILSLRCMHSRSFSELNKLNYKRQYSYYLKLLNRKYFKQKEIEEIITKYLNCYSKIAKRNVHKLTFVLKDVNFGNIMYDSDSQTVALIDFSSFGKGFAVIDYSFLYTNLLQSKYFISDQKTLFIREVFKFDDSKDMNFLFWFDVLVRILEEKEFWQSEHSPKIVNKRKQILSIYNLELEHIEAILNELYFKDSF